MLRLWRWSQNSRFKDWQQVWMNPHRYFQPSTLPLILQRVKVHLILRLPLAILQWVHLPLVILQWALLSPEVILKWVLHKTFSMVLSSKNQVCGCSSSLKGILYSTENWVQLVIQIVVLLNWWIPCLIILIWSLDSCGTVYAIIHYDESDQSLC